MEAGIEEIAKDVIHVPDSAVNLLSINKMITKGLSVHFTSQGSSIEDEKGKLIATMINEGDIFRLEIPKERIYFAAKIQRAELWHRRLGHLNDRSAETFSKRLAQGISIKCFEGRECVACIKGKPHCTPFPKRGRIASKMLELIHSDLCGSMETSSLVGLRYILTLIDDFIRKIFMFFLKQKNKISEVFAEFRMNVEKIH